MFSITLGYFFHNSCQSHFEEKRLYTPCLNYYTTGFVTNYTFPVVQRQRKNILMPNMDYGLKSLISYIYKAWLAHQYSETITNYP